MSFRLLDAALRRPLSLTLGALFCTLALLAFGMPARAQSGMMDFAGQWSVQFVDDFGQQRRCTLILNSVVGITGGQGVSALGCGLPLATAARWRNDRERLVITDAFGTTLATLRGRLSHLSGRTARGQSISMWRTSGEPGSGMAAPLPSPQPQGCAVFYGQSNRCAAADDLAIPRFLPSQTQSLRIVYPANLRVAPSSGAPVIAVIPLNQCVLALSCSREMDGQGWCRVRHGNQIGFIVKQFERAGRRQILFSNNCGGG